MKWFEQLACMVMGLWFPVWFQIYAIEEHGPFNYISSAAISWSATILIGCLIGVLLIASIREFRDSKDKGEE